MRLEGLPFDPIVAWKQQQQQQQLQTMFSKKEKNREKEKDVGKMKSQVENK